jgi:DNA-directed RNA polymerase II subunit RPB2
MDESIIWTMLDRYFKEAPDSLVCHNLESYNDFFKNGIYQIFKEKNPVRLESNYDEKIDDYRNKCEIYCGGINGDKIYFGKPIIYDNNNSHYMFPNEARLRNMTYAMTIHYDVDVVFTTILKDGEQPEMIGGNSEGLDEHTEDARDYNASYNFDNYKTDDGFEAKVDGGAMKKIDRKRVVKEYNLTANEATELKEKTHASMINSNTQSHTITMDKVFLGKFPVMLQSDFCILKGMSPEARHSAGECRQDLGGYFIIQGKEKAVISQEKFADNMLYVRKYIKEDGDDVLELDNLYSAELRSVSENASKPIRKLSMTMVAPTTLYTNLNIVVNIPNVRQPVPLFIVMRALGIITDKAIIETCLLDIDKYEGWLDDFIPSVHDAGGILTQKLAIDFIASLTKGKRIEHGLEILSDYLLPHIGETNYIEKAYFIGHMVYKMLRVANNVEQPTDRDNFKYKRVELVGSLLYDLFRDYYTEQQNHIRLEYDKRLNFNLNLYASNLNTLISTYQNEIFRERVIEQGFNKAFKGNWGAKPNTKRIGVLQDLNRLSFNGYLSHLRKTNLPMDSSAKVTGPRLLHGSQWGLIDPLDTPDGGNIGLHKSLAIMTRVTQGGIGMRKPIVEWLREKTAMKYVYECTPKMLAIMTKVFVNGHWAGSILEPFENIRKIKLYRRNGLLSMFTSIGFDIKSNMISIYTDGGRLCRPIFYKDELTNKLSYESVKDKLVKGDFTWANLTLGFNKHRENLKYKKENYTIYELNQLFDNIKTETNPAKLDRFINNKGIIDYIDSNESENAMICMEPGDFDKKPHTHLEIHQSLIFGTMGNLIIYPENNPPTRNAFSCGQSKQACSIYHTNFHVRMDKAAVVLNYGQCPLVKTRYLDYINHEETPYGENTVVAIMCYGGYNMEDSVLINEGSLKRGLFNTTYYTSYESHEEIKETTDGNTENKFANIESDGDIVGLKPGYDYSKLDKYGIIREGTLVDDKTILIGMYTTGENGKSDASKVPKKGQLGVVDKSFITEGEEGRRIAKIRIREIRIPTLGDKVGSRHGQKGTCGLVVPETDMPFGRDGTRPDIIINPHAIPSRMTIGQLVECLTGKACALLGGFGDGTAFVNKGNKVGVYGELLTKMGYHSSGNEILYNGQSGEQLETEIFMGPTYYMRLKHMVKDKVNYRALGPMTSTTRQPVSGRANDGGLRIGEMERDSLISHGVSEFLRESMMERSDKYRMAVCNTTGMMAIYNPEKNLFMSPMADGPIKFTGSLDGQNMNIVNVTQHGRDFSIVDIPYSLKLLMQELNTINLQMRIITEDNIDQLESMTFSKNMTTLGVASHHAYKTSIAENLKEAKDDTDTPVKEPTTPENNRPNESPDYPPSPLYAPSTPDDNQNWSSPPYAPATPDDNQNWSSPPYAPATPDDNQNWSSPPYAPATPDDNQPATPDYAPPTAGGGDRQPKYNINDKVYYRGDKSKSMNGQLQKWKIIKGGNNFLTIKRENEPGKMFNPMKDLQIVKPEDIYYDSDIIYNTPNLQSQGLSTEQPQSGNNINFAPIINVNTKEMESDTENPIVKISDEEHIDNIADIKYKHHDDDERPPLIEAADKPIDFNKLIIKKV